MSKLALVTGASSGVGAATSVALARRGYRVVLCARRAERLAEVAEQVRAAGGEAIVEPLDAGDGEAVLAMASRVLEEHGTPDVIVNSAGAGRWMYIEDTSPDELDLMMAAPFRAAFHTTHAFMAALVARGRGIVVHVNSPACLMPWPGSAGYACSRYALRGLHEALLADLAGTGVHSCHVVLGEIDSEYFDANPGTRENLPGIARVIPVSSPADCANWILELVDRPRPQLVRPWVLWSFHQLNVLLPSLVRALMVATGRKRLGQDS